MDFLGFEVQAEPVGVLFPGGDSVIAYQRVADAENLSRIGRISETFRVADHGCREDDFAAGGSVVAETPSPENMPVLENKRCFLAIL